jgi:hypothetical protein
MPCVRFHDQLGRVDTQITANEQILDRRRSTSTSEMARVASENYHTPTFSIFPALRKDLIARMGLLEVAVVVLRAEAANAEDMCDRK